MTEFEKAIWAEAELNGLNEAETRKLVRSIETLIDYAVEHSQEALDFSEQRSKLDVKE